MTSWMKVFQLCPCLRLLQSHYIKKDTLSIRLPQGPRVSIPTYIQYNIYRSSFHKLLLLHPRTLNYRQFRVKNYSYILIGL